MTLKWFVSRPCRRMGTKGGCFSILMIGKRHYTNRDALEEQFGRVYRLPMHWSRQGVKTQLWLIDYHGRDREQRQDGAMWVDSCPIHRVGWMIKAAALVLSRFRRRSPTHIIASGDAYIGLFGWLMARLSRACFTFDVYDKYDEFSGYRKPFGWDLFGFLLRHADQCWFASRRLLKQLGSPARSDRLVMNGIDMAHFKPLDMYEARRYFGLPVGTTLVGYFGSMEKDRGVSDLIDAVSILRQRGHDVSLVLSGHRHSDTPFPQAFWLHYLGNLPFGDIPRAYAVVNIVAIPYRRSAFMDAGASNKIAEALACGCLLVATETPNFTDNFPHAAQILKTATAKPAHPDSLAAAIAEQLLNPRRVPMPNEMGYEGIAADTLVALKGMQERRNAVLRSSK